MTNTARWGWALVVFICLVMISVTAGATPPQVGEAAFTRGVVTAPPVRTVRFMGFLDTGQINLESPHPGQRGAQALTSIGAGLRWQWRRHVSVSLDAALVLDGSETTRSGDGKIHFNILYRF